MNDNLIPFPKRENAIKDPFYNYVNANDLIALRKAFDRARQNWPIELAELPENNKFYYYKK